MQDDGRRTIRVSLAFLPAPDPVGLRPKPRSLLASALSDLNGEGLADGALHPQELVHESCKPCTNCAAVPHEWRRACTNCVMLADQIRARSGPCGTRLRCDPRPQSPDAAAAHRNGVALIGVQLNHLPVAGTLAPDHAIDVDDMAAVDTHEALAVEPCLDLADRKRAEQLVAAIEDIGIVSIGVDGYHVLHRQEVRSAVALGLKMPR